MSPLRRWLCAVIASASFVVSHPSTWSLVNNFVLTIDATTNSILVQDNHGRTIWETITGSSFLSASSGTDNILSSQGNFEIEQIDSEKCDGLSIEQVTHGVVQQNLNESAVVISGQLKGCGTSTATFDLSFWVPNTLPDRVAFQVSVQPDPAATDPVTKIYLTFRSEAAEDFYGLGAQASYASLKNQSVPIFSREQGVGRGDQPTTEIEDAESFFAGGDSFTTYTAVPQYISTSSRVFYLGSGNNAYANFDFQDPAAVTVRYDALEMDGHLMQAENMLDAITMLTNYTGRMLDLPQWVDQGAILGIQGGEQKVNSIVEQGLQQKCPIAGVWLQDWYVC